MGESTNLICECGHEWREELYFDVERRWEGMGTDGLLANAPATCSVCGYKGVARGIIPDGDSQLKFYLKRENSLYFPRGGWKPSSSMGSSIILNPAKELNIHLYGEPSCETLDLGEIAYYLRRKVDNISVDLRDPFFDEDFPSNEDFMKKMAEAKIHDFSNPDFRPSSLELERPFMSEEVAYDGFKLLSASRELLGEDELNTQHIHLIFTNCYFGTWDEKDKRYHLRLSSYGFPSLISTTGIVEAPARPSEFYRMKRKRGEEPSEEQVNGKFLSHNDVRLTEALKGISMQAIFYHLTGEPFCVTPLCRLFNGHWQEEVLESQMDRPEFCSAHEKILENLNKKQ
ncbi:hypothetical protein AKJ37_07980 [candidate division MSBL1 archaeon SCGC-AAA259I09]|uniref:Uncharacterized protein n=1 Tax=candidate division MSBL1 archaeon SCGC-AAA259I09 TaxID=1698267 RepID=A0A133UIM8_9EURY|nr:hypothetical protein AKJ37_07980 [candidate division MSBL1 archaeon SCGC-AAA259I09]